MQNMMGMGSELAKIETRYSSVENDIVNGEIKMAPTDLLSDYRYVRRQALASKKRSDFDMACIWRRMWLRSIGSEISLTDV